MTSDELIAKLLDGTLSQAEQSQLDAMIDSSPELAEEIRHLRAIEELLVSQPAEQVPHAASFLHSVEDKIAASLVSAGTATSVARYGSFPRVIVAPLLVLVSSIGVFFAIRSNSDAPVAVTSARNEAAPSLNMTPPAENPREVLPSTEHQPNTVARSRTAKPVQPQAEHVVAAVEPQRTQPVAPDVQEDASAKINQSVSPEVERCKAQLSEAVGAGNALQVLDLTYKLGSLLRKNNDPQAASVLRNALQLSREQQQVKYEALSLGELGLLARAEGNAELAHSYLRSCVSLLEQLNETQLAKTWRSRAAR